MELNSLIRQIIDKVECCREENMVTVKTPHGNIEVYVTDRCGGCEVYITTDGDFKGKGLLERPNLESFILGRLPEVHFGSCDNEPDDADRWCYNDFGIAEWWGKYWL